MHYRGTDHWDELPGGELLPVELFLHTVHTIIDQLPPPPPGGVASPSARSAAAAARRVVVFVAADSDEAVDHIRSRLAAAYSSLGGSAGRRVQLTVVSAQDVVRRRALDDAVAIHHAGGAEGVELGRQVLVDALLLSRCDHLVHTQSNVAAFAA